MCSEQDPLAHFKRLQKRSFGFSQKETGAKSVAGTKFEEHCYNTSRVID